MLERRQSITGLVSFLKNICVVVGTRNRPFIPRLTPLLCARAWRDTQALQFPMAFTSRSHAGFTLIELLIVISIVAILAAVATPLYSDQVRRGHRAAAQSVLLDAAARQRQFLIDQRSFAGSISELGVSSPAALTGKYALSVEAATGATPPTFRIIATPAGQQSVDRCGVLSIDQAGTRLPAACW